MFDPDEKASGSAKPTSLFGSDVGSTRYIASAAEDNIPFLHDVPRETISILIRYSSNANQHDLVITQLLRHHDRRAFGLVIMGVQLATEWASLYESIAVIHKI
jgi:hypothetical protein